MFPIPSLSPKRFVHFINNVPHFFVFTTPSQVEKMLAISICIDYPEHINADCTKQAQRSSVWFAAVIADCAPSDLLNTQHADFLIGFSSTAHFRGT